MARKPSARDPHINEGKKVLDEWGVNLARFQDGSLTMAQLEERIGQHPAADVALAALLGDYLAPEAAQLLVAWETKTGDKNLRREIHRSLYKLSQKGIAVDRPAEEPTRPILTPIEPEGYLSVMDGRGDRLIWLTKPRAGGGLHYLSALVNEPKGMRHVEAAEVTRKGIRLMRQELHEHHQIAMTETAWRYCDFLMSEGYDRAKARNGKEVESYPALRSHLLSTPAHPVDVPLPASLDPAAIAADEQLVATSIQLFNEPEIQQWLLDHEQAHRYVDEIVQAQESPLVLSRHQQQDRMQIVVEKAITEVFSAESSQAYARRLKEMALHLATSDRLESAKRAVAVAVTLQQKAAGNGIPFCEELIRQSIAAHYHEERQKEQEESQGSLIMKPAEFAARVQEAQRRRGR